MPIEILNQTTGSNPFEFAEGFEQLNGAVDFRAYLSSIDKSAGQNSLYSFLEFTKTQTTNLDQPLLHLDLETQADGDLVPFQIDPEPGNVQAFQNQEFNVSLLSTFASESTSKAAFVADAKTRVFYQARHIIGKSFFGRQRAAAAVGKNSPEVIKVATGVDNGHSMALAVETEGNIFGEDSSAKVDFVMVDPDAKLLPLNRESLTEVAPNPDDGVTANDQAIANQKARLEVVNFGVEATSSAQSDYASLSLDASVNAGLQSYVGATTVQENLKTKQQLKLQLLSQTARAIATRFRQDGDKQTVSLELNPAELGHLKILIERNGDKIQATIIASQEVTREMLTDEHDQLLQKLRDLEVGQTEIEIIYSEDLNSDDNRQFDLPGDNSTMRMGINMVA